VRFIKNLRTSYEWDSGPPPLGGKVPGTMRKVIASCTRNRDHFTQSVASSLSGLGLDRIENQRITFEDGVMKSSDDGGALGK
jgi:hypothetical protein